MELLDLQNRFKTIPSRDVESLLSDVNQLLEQEFTKEGICFKIALLEELHKNREALDLLDSLSTEDMTQIQTFEFMLHKAHILFRLAEIRAAKNLIDQCEEFVHELKPEQPNALSDQISLFYHVKGLIHWKLFDYDKAIASYTKSLELRKLANNLRGVAHSLNNMGIIYSALGDLDTAIGYFTESLNVSNSIENYRTYGMTMNNLAGISIRQGDLESVEINSKKIIELGEDELIPEFTLGFGYRNLGMVYFFRGNLSKAIRYLDIGLDKFKSSSYASGEAVVLWYLIRIHISLKDDELVDKYFERLENLANQAPEELIITSYRLSMAFILKNYPRVKHKIEAEVIFEEIVKGPIVFLDFTVFAILNYCELLIYELKLSYDKEIFDELDQSIISLEEIAVNQQSKMIEVEAKLLKSKLALLELDINRGRQLLIDARMIAVQNHLDRLALTASRLLDNLIENFDRWQELADSSKEDKVISKSIELSQVEDLFAHLYYQKNLVQNEPQKENPILFLVLNEGGTPIITRKYDPHNMMQEMLFGNVLTAIYSLANEVFDSQFDVQTIIHGPFTILLMRLDRLFFSYVFEGTIHYGFDKLNLSVNILKRNETLYHKLKTKHIHLLNEYEPLLAEIDEIFL